MASLKNHLQGLFGGRHEVSPTMRVTVAVYPDGHECRIERTKRMGPGNLWLYDRDSAAGPGKANAIASAKSEGAVIETRTVPNPNYKARR